MSKYQLPDNIKKQIDKKIICFAKSDIGDNHKFSDGYAMVCDKEIYIAKAKTPNNRMFFRGINSESEDIDFTIKSYKPTKLELNKTVNGGMIVAKTDSGDILLAEFTNHCCRDMQTLIDTYNSNLADDTQKAKDEQEKPSHPPLSHDNRDEEACPKCGCLYPDSERKICPKCMDKRSIFLKTLKYFKPYRWKIVLMMVCFVLTAGLNLVWPYLNGRILYDKIFAKNETFLNVFNLPAGKFVAALGIVVITMLISKLFMQLLGIIQGVVTAKIVPDVVKNIKSDVFRSMGRLSIGFYNSRQTGSLMTRIVSDADRVTSLYLDGLPFAIINVITIIATVVVLLKTNLILGIWVICFIPVLIFLSLKMFPAQWNLFGKHHRAERGLNSQIHDNIMGARVVKSFGQQKNENKRFDKYNKRQQDADLAIVSFDNRFQVIYNGTKSLLMLLSWGLGSYFVVTGTNMTLGLLITFTSYVEQLNGPLDHISRMFRMWAESMNAAQRLFEIIEAVPDINEKKNPVVLKEIKGDIELRGVSFGYEPHRPVLKDINLKIDGGKMLGIVGRSGAGKSTLVNLISRLYDPDEGEILLDGVNIRELSFAQLRQNVAMVSQETYVFIGTVAENIAYAKPDATKQEIINAAVLASAHDFICKMPDGYDTVIGSSGRSLSGGERQRISIARAILANPKILILDEATASVDTETEKAIQKSINYLIKGRTTISIAHRLSTLKDAERLAVIDDGKLIEEGTAKELWEQKGIYFKLRELQTKALAMKGLE